MTAIISTVGGALLAAATLPQAWQMLKRRRADDFSWPFILLNSAGLVLLAIRSAHIREWNFLAINVLAALFWLLVAAIKVLQMHAGRSDRTGAGAREPAASQ